VSYIVNDAPEGRGRGRRPILVALAVIVVLLVAAVAFLIGRGGEPDQAQTPISVIGTGSTDLTWQQVGAQPVPASPLHGPLRQSAGVVAGFSHDELGAALAAINISARLSSSAGAAVYEATARQQCVGDVERAIATSRSESASSSSGNAPTEYLYRISGDPASEVVVVSIAAATPEATGMHGYAEITRTLQWIDGDWKLQVPVNRPRLISSTDGYRSLGGPHA
jgi:hypothetical protein